MLAQLPQIDVVCVSVRPPLHFEVVIAALEAGKHVYCEQPLGLSTAQAREMYALAKRKRLRTIVGHQSHHEPAALHMAALVRDQGDLARAMSLFQESLALRWTRGEKRGVAEAMAGLAEIVAPHEPQTSARLFGAVDGLRESSGIRIPPPEQRIYDRALVSLATVLGRRRFEQELAVGRELPSGSFVMTS